MVDELQIHIQKRTMKPLAAGLRGMGRASCVVDYRGFLINVQ
jgi:hypothetical protein